MASVLRRNRPLVLSFVAFAILSVALSAVHEGGHLLGCTMQGGQGQVSVSVLADSVTICEGVGQDDKVVAVMGGGLASIAAGLSVLMLRRYNWLVTALAALTAGQLLMMTFETWWTADYLSNLLNATIGTTVMGTFGVVAFITRLVPLRHKKHLLK